MNKCKSNEENEGRITYLFPKMTLPITLRRLGRWHYGKSPTELFSMDFRKQYILYICRLFLFIFLFFNNFHKIKIRVTKFTSKSIFFRVTTDIMTINIYSYSTLYYNTKLRDKSLFFASFRVFIITVDISKYKFTTLLTTKGWVSHRF